MLIKRLLALALLALPVFAANRDWPYGFTYDWAFQDGLGVDVFAVSVASLPTSGEVGGLAEPYALQSYSASIPACHDGFGNPNAYATGACINQIQFFDASLKTPYQAIAYWCPTGLANCASNEAPLYQGVFPTLDLTQLDVYHGTVNGSSGTITAFDPPAPTTVAPEPGSASTVGLALTGAIGLAMLARARRARHARLSARA